MPPNVGVFGTSGSSSASPLTVPQATNPIDANQGTVSGAVLKAAVDAGENAGYIGTLNASLGLIPSGLTPDGRTMRAGDHMFIGTAGTLPVGVVNGPTASVGQQITALVDNPTLPSHWALSASPAPLTVTAGVVTAVLANGQTSFTLSPAPANAASVVMEVNGIRYFNVSDFTISGATVTWLNGFTLDTTDTVRFYYS